MSVSEPHETEYLTNREEYELDEDLYEWILEKVEERTSPEEPWDSEGYLRQQIRKAGKGPRNDISQGEFHAHVFEAIDNGDLFGWHGKLALPQPERLKTIIRQERDGPRDILTKKARKRLEALESDA